MPVSPELLIPLIEQRDQLEQIIYDKQKELSQVNAAIRSLSNEVNEQRFNWTEQAINCITRNKVFLQTNDILECVFNKDYLSDERKRRGGLVGISVALNNLCSKNILRKIVVQGVKGHFYGLPDWFGSDNKPKAEFVANLMARYGKVSEPVKLNQDEVENIVSGGFF